LTGTKHPAISTNHLTDIDKTKHNNNQRQHKQLNNLLKNYQHMHKLHLTKSDIKSFHTDSIYCLHNNTNYCKPSSTRRSVHCSVCSCRARQSADWETDFGQCRHRGRPPS